MDTVIIIWLAALICCTVAEALTVQLICIWFAASALAALILAVLGAPLGAQIAVFLLCAAALLVFTRPLAKRLMNRPAERTNADRVLGGRGVVLEEIDNSAAKGQVKVNNQIWSARSAAGCVIPAGAAVSVRSIEGVKVIVDEIPEKNTYSEEVAQCR